MSPGFKDHFSAAAEGYRAHRPQYPDELVAYLRSLVSGPGTVWEAGCGSGQLTLTVADAFDRIVATDASSEQLEQAPPHPNVEYRCEPAERTSIESARIDLCVSAQAAHWFDLDAYYAEVRRAGRAGGHVVLITYATMMLEGFLDEVVERFYREVVGPYWPAERVLVERGYRTLPFPFHELEPPALEMVADWELDQLVGYVGTWSASIALRRQAGEAPFQQLKDELRAHWGPRDRRRIRWPLFLRVGRV